MRTEHFKYFIAVAKEGSFSKASRAVYLSEPTLNKNITAFEAELGFKLFVRSKRCLELTDEGRMFLPMAEEIVKTIDNDVTTVRESANKKQSQLRVNHVALDSDSVFSDTFIRIAECNPVIDVVICEGDPRRYRERLLGGTRDTDIEFTILNGLDTLPASIDYRVIKDVHETIVVTKNSPLANKSRIDLADLRGKKLVFSSAMPNEAHQELIKQIETGEDTPDLMFVNSISSALKLCDFNNYCMVKTSMYTVPEGYVAVPLETGFASMLVALWNKNNPSMALACFVRALDSVLAEREPSICPSSTMTR